MNICVCVKQVPDTTEIKIDPVKHTLIRDGVPSIVNPYDTCALEAAARIKDANPEANIVAISMGPDQAKKALKECMAIAADKAYLVTDRAFGGSDTLATSYILAEAIKQIETIEGKFDAIFCGKQAIDGDTAQVGSQIAENLDYPQVTYALEAYEEEKSLRILQQGSEEKFVVGVDLPCVVTFTPSNFDVRYPTMKRKMAANRAQIPNITSGDIPGIDLTRCGLKGSPTRVKKTFVPVRDNNVMIVDEGTVEESSVKLISVLSEASII